MAVYQIYKILFNRSRQGNLLSTMDGRSAYDKSAGVAGGDAGWRASTYEGEARQDACAIGEPCGEEARWGDGDGGLHYIKNPRKGELFLSDEVRATQMLDEGRFTLTKKEQTVSRKPFRQPTCIWDT